MIKQISIILILSIAFFCNGQHRDHDGKTSVFFMNNGNESLKPVEKVTISLHDFQLQSLNNLPVRSSFKFSFFPQLDFSAEATRFQHEVMGEIYPDGTISSDASNIQFILPENIKRRNSRHIYAFGNLKNNFKFRNKIRRLDFAPSLGREHDFERFKNLEIFFSQEHQYGTLGFNPRKVYSAIGFKYPGDLNLWKDLEKAKKLKQIKFVGVAKHFYSERPENIYSLNGISPNLFCLSELKNLYLDGPDFLPLNFHKMNKLENLLLFNFYEPELINLAAVMYRFGKDRTKGNWGAYLSKVDLNKLDNLPINGEYKVFYKNGNYVCKGAYINGKPHGNWEFRYEDGRLCQRRSYNMGERKGIWRFNRPTYGVSLADSVFFTELHYHEGRLIKRVSQIIDYTYDHERDCNSMEHSFESIIKMEYQLTYLENEIKIFKTVIPYGPLIRRNGVISFSNDTLDRETESWSYTDSLWTYELNKYCSNQSSPMCKKRMEGRPYHGAHLSSKTKIYYDSKTIEVIDMKNCKWQRKDFSRKNMESDFELINEQNEMFSPEEWLCD